MAKRKKRAVATKKKKEEDEIEEETCEEPLAKKVAVSSTSNLEDEMSQASSFSVEGFNIGKSETMGSEVGFSSHFWCNYCEFSSDTKKELITHMRQHMVKCSYCTFSSLSRAEIAKHVKCEHEEEAEKAICEVDSSSSGTEHDMDKDPCSACIFCEFMTYSTEHLEKHTTSKHQGLLPKSVAKMISKQVSARIRRADALFYTTISSDCFDKPEVEDSEYSDHRGPIVLEPDSIDVKPMNKDLPIQPQSPPKTPKIDVKPNTSTLSKTVANDQKPVITAEQKDAIKPNDWKVKVETLYCLSCPYSNVAIEKLKCHTLAQHPQGAAAASFNSEGACRLQDISFFCIRENCSHTNVQCSDYEDHLITCCSPEDSLMFGERERIACTVEFIFKFQKKQGIKGSERFLEFASQFVNNQQSTDPISANLPASGHTGSDLNRDENNFITSKLEVQESISHGNDQPVALPSPLLEDIPNTQVSFKDTFIDSSNNFNQPHILSEPPTIGQPQNVPVLGQDANIFSATPTSCSGGLNLQDSNAAMVPSGHLMEPAMMNSNYSGQTLLDNMQHGQQMLNSNQINNNFHNNTNCVAPSFNTPPMYNQEPASFNFNTNTVSSGQQNVFSQPMQNPEVPMNNYNSSFPVMSGQSSHSFPTQQLLHERAVPRMNAALSTTVNQSTNPSANIFPDIQPPKMLDLLSNTHSILLDDDLDIQPWPATHQGTSSSHPPQPNVVPPMAQSSSLSTPPLPNNTQPPFPSQESSSMFESNFGSNSQSFSNFPQPDASRSVQQTPPIPAPYPAARPSSYNQAQLPLGPSAQTQNGTDNTLAIDLNDEQAFTPNSNFPPQAQTLNQPHSSNSGENGYHQNIVPGANQASNASSSNIGNQGNHVMGQAASVPNFLVPSSNPVSSESLPNQHQTNSFLHDNTVQPQSPSHQSLANEQLALTPTQNARMLNSGNGNSPLSPSIYLSGKALRNQRSSWNKEAMMPRGLPPPQFRMQQGMQHPMNFNHPSPHARQRLFSPNAFSGRGRPRGSRMQHGMIRPPVNSGDDDVIVTAVVRGPAPQRPPMNQRGRGGAPRERGGIPRGRGGFPRERGGFPRERGGFPRERGGIPRGRGGFPRGAAQMNNIRSPSQSPNQPKKPFDVSRHFVDLACVVNANEEMEADEIQIVGVTPGKGGKMPPKTVDANNFSYCCIHCGKDQGSKQIMKRHIKSNHSESLLGAFRNVETGQWLYFCPQLTCEFMTYDENRLTDHLFSCYNLDRNKQLPFDMESALKNLKALKIRQVNVHSGVGQSQTTPIDLDGQGLRDTFNNNLKDAFDDMVENTFGRQTVRPNQPPPSRPPQYGQSGYPSHRGALRGSYPPRGPPPFSTRGPRGQNIRQRGPGHIGIPPGYRQRGPRQPHYPYPTGFQGRPRAPGQAPHPRAMPPVRGGDPMRGQRPPSRGFMPRPNLIGMPGNEQTPIVIDLDADSPEKEPESEIQNVPQIEPQTTTEHVTHSTQMALSSFHNDLGSGLPPPSAVSDINMVTSAQSNQTTNTAGAIPFPSNQSENTSQNVTPASGHLLLSAMLDGSVATSLSSQQNITGAPTTSLDNSNTSNNSIAGCESLADGVPQSSPESANTESHSTNSQSEQVFVPTSLRDIPSPSQLLSEMNALSKKDIPSPTQLLSEMNALSKKGIPSPTQLLSEMNALSKTPTGQRLPDTNVSQNDAVNREETSSMHQGAQEGNAPAPHTDPNDNDEELVNTILLDKVFAKVPHMPKKLSQRLVLKFKKYAADRGVIITPHSKVIDEFVSKISYKGSHSTPTGGQVNSESVQPSQAAAMNPVQPMSKDNLVTSNSSTSQPSSFSNAGALLENPNSSLQSSPHAPPVLNPSQPSSQTHSSTISNTANNFTDSDVMETKIIVPERSLQFSGAFANIVKGNTQSKTVADKNAMTDYEKGESVSRQPSFSELTALSPGDDDGHIPASDHVDTAELSRLVERSREMKMIEKTLKKEFPPISFPSGSKEESIEIKSSVDHLICGHASLEVDIAGKPLCSNDLNDKTMDSLSVMERNDESDSSLKKLDKDGDKVSYIDHSSGRLLLKVRKNNKPRVPCSKDKEDYSPPGNEESIIPMDDHIVRRSERKRKAVKVDYEPDELSEMHELMSDDDDEYHMESEDDYHGSDSDNGGKKRVKKIKCPPDPTAFDISTKGCYGCWKCSKRFSRIMFLKRHIEKKHKEGLCAIILSETDAPEGPNLLLFCPQLCKYVTSDSKAYSAHLESCAQSPLNVEDVDYRTVQQNFLASGFNTLVEGIASGTISTKIPKGKPTVPRKKTSGPPQPQSSAKEDMVQHEGHNTIVTTALVHAPPREVATSHVDHTQTQQSSMSHFSQENAHSDQPIGEGQDYPYADAMPGQNMWDPNDVVDYEDFEESYNDYDEELGYEEMQT